MFAACEETYTLRGRWSGAIDFHSIAGPCVPMTGPKLAASISRDLARREQPARILAPVLTSLVTRDSSSHAFGCAVRLMPHSRIRDTITSSIIIEQSSLPIQTAVVEDELTCPPEVLQHRLEYFRFELCPACFPWREGSGLMHPDRAEAD